MELIKIWEIIWQRKWILVQAILIISISAITGSHLITPVYSTSAKVLIESSDASSSILAGIGMEDLSSLFTTSESESETYIELATVNPILEEVISRLQIKDRSGSIMDSDKLQKSIPILSTFLPMPYVEVNQVENTNLFEIEVTSPDHRQAAMIANTLAEVYIEKNLMHRRADYRSARIFIEDQIKVVKADYLNALEEIKSFKIKEKTVDIEHETKLAIDKMAELMEEKEDNIIDISEVKAKVATLRVQLDKQNGMVISSTAINENPHIENLKKTLIDLQLQLASELTEKRSDHPDIISLKKRINLTREEMAREVITYKDSSSDLEAMERELAALEIHLKGVSADIKKYMVMFSTLPDKIYNESQLQLKLLASQDLYSSLIEYYYQIGVAEAMTISDIRLVEGAKVPKIDEPQSPNKPLISIIGVFLGIMAGLGLVFLVDYLDDTIKTPDDAKDQGLNLLGAIPKIKKKKDLLITDRDPKDPLCEAYRTTRNNLKYASLDKPIKSLVITSSLQGEGKTTSVVNIGICISRDKKQTIIVDTDLRLPSIHKIFGLSNTIGVTNILAGEASLDEAIIESKVEGLSLITSGPIPPDPGHIVESNKIKSLIHDLEQRFDIVILDTPPVLATSDAIILTANVDALILILESGVISERALKVTKDLLKRGNIEPAGCILNKFTVKHSSGYYYSYYHKSGYYTGKKK